MHFTHFMNATRVEKHPLRQGGLARIDVRADPDIPRPFEGITTG